MNLVHPALFLCLAATAFAAPPGDQRTRGATVFSDSGCHQCHTIRHNGGTKGPDLSGVGRRLTEDQLRTQILQGGHQMPPFGDVLQKSELDDLVSYLHSCRDKKPK
jgi:mono/diheme cytochrome c family protein